MLVKEVLVVTNIVTNGFGRIGRLVLSAMSEQGLIENVFDVVTVVNLRKG